MRCQICSKHTWFSSICKECEAIKLEKWREEHTFIFGEIVNVLDRGKIFCSGVVKGKGEYCSSFGYFSLPYYEVEFPDGKIKNIEVMELQKDSNAQAKES